MYIHTYIHAFTLYVYSVHTLAIHIISPNTLPLPHPPSPTAHASPLPFPSVSSLPLLPPLPQSPFLALSPPLAYAAASSSSSSALNNISKKAGMPLPFSLETPLSPWRRPFLLGDAPFSPTHLCCRRFPAAQSKLQLRDMHAPKSTLVVIILSATDVNAINSINQKNF